LSTYELGQTITFTVQVVDDAGQPADLGGGNPTCTVIKPDGASTNASVSKPSTGLYWGSLAATALAGRYRGTFTGTGLNSGKLPFTDVIDVWPADPRLIIGLADARAELSMPANHTVDDDLLRLYIAATTPLVEEIVGTVLTSTEVEIFDGGRTAVLLSERASAITSVTVNGAATTDYTANLDSGIVYAGGQAAPSTFSWGRQNVAVTYTSGGSSIDPNVKLAAAVIAAHLYQVGQQGRRGRNQTDDIVVLSSGYAVPSRAIELCRGARSRRMPGFA
jgi:hypothetical protein